MFSLCLWDLTSNGSTVTLCGVKCKTFLSLRFAKSPVNSLRRQTLKAVPCPQRVHNVMGYPGKGTPVTHFDQRYKRDSCRIMLSPAPSLTRPRVIGCGPSCFCLFCLTPSAVGPQFSLLSHAFSIVSCHLSCTRLSFKETGLV